MSTKTTNSYTKDNEIKVNCVKNATDGVLIGWYSAYGQHGVYAKKAGTDFKSNMIWGSQFDQAIMWLKDVRNPSQGEHVYYVINSTGMNGSDTSKTGQVKVKNIYDLSGGISEFTPAISKCVSTRNGVDANKIYYSLLPSKREGVNGSSRLVLY